MGNQTTTTVSTEQGDVLCHKMVFGDYALLLRALDKLPKLIGDLLYKKEGKDSTEFSQAEIIGNLPLIAAEALPELAAVIASATDKDAEFISKLDLADVVDVVDGVLTVNDVDRIIASIKKLAALRVKAKPDGTSKTST